MIDYFKFRLQNDPESLVGENAQSIIATGSKNDMLEKDCTEYTRDDDSVLSDDGHAQIEGSISSDYQQSSQTDGVVDNCCMTKSSENTSPKQDCVRSKGVKKSDSNNKVTAIAVFQNMIWVGTASSFLHVYDTHSQQIVLAEKIDVSSSIINIEYIEQESIVVTATDDGHIILLPVTFCPQISKKNNSYCFHYGDSTNKYPRCKIIAVAQEKQLQVWGVFDTTAHNGNCIIFNLEQTVDGWKKETEHILDESYNVRKHLCIAQTAFLAAGQNHHNIWIAAEEESAVISFDATSKPELRRVYHRDKLSKFKYDYVHAPISFSCCCSVTDI